MHVQVMTTDMTTNAPLDEAAEAIARQAADRAAEAARAAAYEEALATIAAENEAKRAEEQRLTVEAQKAAAHPTIPVLKNIRHPDLNGGKDVEPCEHFHARRI